MAKSTKIITIIFCSLVAVLCVAIGVSTLKSESEKKGEGKPTVSQSTTVASTAPTSTTAASDVLSVQIIGKWRDSADMSGFEFFSDGTVEITYVNLTVPIINIPVNGTTKGIYTLEGDKLTTKFTIYSTTIEDTYTVSVNGNNLSMTNHDGNETTTYMRAKKEAETTTAKTTTHPSTTKNSSNVLYDDELIGSWETYDGAVYSFELDGEFELEKNNRDYDGIYLTDEGKITLQYADGGKKITEKYTYSVTKNTLTLSKNGEEILLTREGTGSNRFDESDLFGVWRDGTDMAGFEFKPGGICEITYMNFTVPVVNIPINGTFTGTYEIKGNKLTVSSNIYGNAMNDEFEFSVSGNTLRMKNTETGIEYTYLKK